MRLLVGCFIALLLVLSLLGSGVLNVTEEAPNAVPASISQWWSLIQPAADRYQVDPMLIAAVMMQESGGNRDSRSRAGANGLMQILDGPFDPSANVDSGVRILAGHLKTFNRVRVALAAYNAGPGVLDVDLAANPGLKFAGVRGAAREAAVTPDQFDKYFQYLPAETRRYVPSVMSFYDRYAGGPTYFNSNDGPGRYPLDKFRWSPTFGKNIGNGQAAHTGEDLIAPCGTPVKAAFNGDVAYRGCLYGNCKDGGVANGATGHGLVIVEQFDTNKYAVYAHLANYIGDKTVSAGDIVGTIGMTGWTLGCHLHYAIWQGTLEDLLKAKGNNWLDPKKFFPAAPSKL
jgi:murein DD-endopeptidase MepM/ murein hydrolase activator NlpD